MNIPSGLGLPPLAGLATYEEAARIGYSVDDNVELMRRYNFVEKKLFELCGAFINPTPEWEVKCALSLHLWLDAEHSQALRQRVAELRLPPLHLDKIPDPKLGVFLEEAFWAQNTVELLTGIFRVIRPALLAAYRKHLAESNPLFDQPTCRILRIAVQEEEDMIHWGEQALAALTQDEQNERMAKAWESHLKAYLQAAGGITGQEVIPEDLELPSARAVEPFTPSVDPRRDWRSGDIYNFRYRAADVYEDKQADMSERILALMFKRFHEMDVPEMMASIIVQTKDKPWEYYRDMARQLWDEARHAMMGEVWFAAHEIDWRGYPNSVEWSLHLNFDREPLERHAILYDVEQGLMDGKTGKRREWLVAQEAQDALATFLHDYDWADEVLHAQIGRRWLKPELGDIKTILALAKEAARKPTPTLEARAKTALQEDWWPRFVKNALGKESASPAGVDLDPVTVATGVRPTRSSSL
jgi:hypothetical protein